MLSAKARNRLLTGLVVGLYVGLALFGATVLYGALIASRTNLSSVRDANDQLGLWVHRVEPPTEARIQAALVYKEGMLEEYQHLRNYHLRRQMPLGRNMLDSFSGDPVQVKSKYLALKRDLQQKGRHTQARAFIPKPLIEPYPWEEGVLTPAPADFPVLEKQAAIAEALVDLLATDSPVAVANLEMGEPAPLPAPAQTDEAGTETLRASAWPVSVEFVVPYRFLGRILRKVAAAPADCPCMKVRGLSFRPVGGGRVGVVLQLHVLDFG